MKAKVENTNLVRDLYSKAVLETDIHKYMEHKKQKELYTRVLKLEKALEELTKHVQN